MYGYFVAGCSMHNAICLFARAKVQLCSAVGAAPAVVYAPVVAMSVCVRAVCWAWPRQPSRNGSHPWHTMYSHYSSWSRSARQNRWIPDLYYDVARVAGWEPYTLHDLVRVSCVGSECTISYGSCTIYHNGRLRSRWSRSWSVLSVRRVQCLCP